VPEKGLFGLDLPELIKRVIIGPTDASTAIYGALWYPLVKAKVPDIEKKLVVSRIPLRGPVYFLIYSKPVALGGTENAPAHGARARFAALIRGQPCRELAGFDLLVAGHGQATGMTPDRVPRQHITPELADNRDVWVRRPRAALFTTDEIRHPMRVLEQFNCSRVRTCECSVQ
jgi:hypothetical protein